jgi:cytochrome c oxidase subunit 2
MFTGVKVMPKEKFDAWLSDTSAVIVEVSEEATPADQGFQVLVKNGCNACHSADGSRLVGPSYLGLWGSTKEVETGRDTREITVDEEYIRRSIYEPNADIAKGFNKGLMLSYEGMVSEEEIALIIEYLKTLND